MTFRFRLTAAALVVACSGGTAFAAQGGDRFTALVGLARLKRDAGDTEASRRFFEEAERLRPLQAGELTEYFWVVAGLDAKLTLAAGTRVLAASPANAVVRDRMIAAAVSLSDEHTIVALALEGQRLDPKTALWPRRLGETYLRQGMASKAADAYAQARGTSDAVPMDRIGLAIALESAGDRHGALQAWADVPPSLVAERPEWTASRLRAVAHAAPLASAITELDAWVATHPADDAIRELLVDLWVRARKPEKALDALGPLTSGPGRDRWLRRETDLAVAAGDPSRAIARLTGLVESGRASNADRWTLASLLADTAQYDAAGAAALAAAAGCDDRLFELLDRVPAPLGANMMVDALTSRGCADHSRWLTRGVERTVAAGRHADALALVGRLPAATRGTRDMRRLEGQLRLWTGDHAGAAAILEPLLLEADDDAAREALVDTYRALGRPYSAWETAEPLLTRPALAPARATALAELAIEADRPRRALAIVDALPRGAAGLARMKELEGRALLADGRPGDALRVLATIPENELNPSAALALLDSRIAMQGRGAVATLAARLDDESPAWRDVLLRRGTLAAIAGDLPRAAAIRAALTRIDPALAAYADAETALALERPLDAIAALDRLAPGKADVRALDLRATALSGAGDLAAAAPIVAELGAVRPAFVAFAIRAAELAWRMNPTPETLGRVLYLPSRFAGNQYASIAAARALASEGRHAEAVGVLASLDEAVELSVDGRIVWARSLHALGRTAGSLALVSDLEDVMGSAAIFRAQVIAAVHGPQQGDAIFRKLAARPSASAEVYVAWSAIPLPPADRLEMLESGAAKFPQHASLLATLASARWAAGDREGARLAAEQAVLRDPHHAGAWFVLIDATAATRARGGLEQMLDRFAASASGHPQLMIGMAERMGGIARTPADPLLAQALQWLNAVPDTSAAAQPRDIARVHVLAAAERWDDAVGAADRAVAVHNRRAPLLKLRAEVLSWSGRHAEALEAYTSYLNVAPDDLEARRQQARVAGWGGRFNDARRLYANLRTAHPADAAIAAEAAAKDAFFGGRWSAAVRSYQRWLALEPDNGEARFEMAEALRAWGHVEQADRALERLESDTGHRLAAAARERVSLNRQPAVSLVSDQRDAEGYDGQRQISFRQQGGAFATSFGATGRTMLSSEGTSVLARGADLERRGYRLGAGAIHRISPALQLEARAALWSFGPANVMTPQVQMRTAWRASDRWTLSAGIDRELLLDNIATIDRAIAGAGPSFATQLQSPLASFEVRTSWQALTDGNSRQRTSISASRTLGERFKHVRAVMWGEALSYGNRSDAYFAPSRFLRLDAGLEYTHRFSEPRFQGDRLGELVTSYLVGTDDRGTRYHQPSVRLAIEVVRGIAVDARAGWIRSATYNEASLSLGLRIAGSGTGR